MLIEQLKTEEMLVRKKLCESMASDTTSTKARDIARKLKNKELSTIVQNYEKKTDIKSYMYQIIRHYNGSMKTHS